MASMHKIHQISVVQLAPVTAELIQTGVSLICIQRTHISPKCLLASWYVYI